MLVDEYQVTFWTRGRYPAAPPQTLFQAVAMTENQLNRGRVIEYGTPPKIGFVRDGESHMQLPFYYRDGRFLTEPYVNGVPSFSQENEAIENNTLYRLREPQVGDELVYRLMGQGALARVLRWTYASHYDHLVRTTEKPA